MRNQPPKTTTAFVTFSLQVAVPANYGPDWKLCDMHKQVETEARAKIASSLSGCRIVGLVATGISTSHEWPNVDAEQRLNEADARRIREVQSVHEQYAQLQKHYDALADLVARGEALKSAPTIIVTAQNKVQEPQ